LCPSVAYKPLCDWNDFLHPLNPKTRIKKRR
jgi:hypothetical protein